MTKEEIDAKSKEEALKPQRYYFNKYLFKCRRCSKVLDIIEHNYCPQCGQKIDWSEYPAEEDEICINNSTSSMLCAKISELVFELETQRKEYYDKRTVLLGQLERLQKAISNEQFSW